MIPLSVDYWHTHNVTLFAMLYHFFQWKTCNLLHLSDIIIDEWISGLLMLTRNTFFGKGSPVNVAICLSNFSNSV